MFDLSGTVALVTGGSMGLGLTFSDTLAEAGAGIALTARTEDLLEQNAAGLRERHGRRVSVHPADVIDADAVAGVIESVVGYFVTEMTRPIFDMLGMAPWIESRTPMRRLGDPERDLRGPILFLASDASSYVTGHNLFVDGGFEASRGAWQIPPSHFSWNKEAPQVGETYPGLVPNEFEQWKMGIPGLHFPLPDAPAEK